MFPDAANRLLTKNKFRIANAVPKSWRPIRNRRLGCGGFGCVFATGTAGMVCKITKDAEEVRIVKKILNEKLLLEGFVRYYKVIELMPVGTFAIWREEVVEMGEFFGFDEAKTMIFKLEPIIVSITDILAAYIDKHKAIQSAAPYRQWALEANLPHSAIDEYRYRFDNGKRLAILLNLYETQILRMVSSNECGDIGYNLLEFFEMGIVLTDVLQRNIGIVRRNGKEMLVIADPSMPAFMI